MTVMLSAAKHLANQDSLTITVILPSANSLRDLLTERS